MLLKHHGLNDQYMARKSVLMISAGMMRPKKANNPFADLHYYLNYGFLGLATILKGKGYHPKLFHGHFAAPQSFINELIRNEIEKTSLPILISIPSSYAIAWTREACRYIKLIRPDAKIIVGGRWVTADDGAWIRKKIPDIDLVFFGLAEGLIESLLIMENWQSIPNNDLSGICQEKLRTSSPNLDYRLLDNFENFTPSFDIARGCGRGCSFCAEGTVPVTSMKNAWQLTEEIRITQEVYEGTSPNAYFEASIFQPASNWIKEFSSLLVQKEMKISWRTESRADALSTRQIEQLAPAGMKILDIGLESASPRQLLSMEKTSNPETYLRRASDLLKACHDNGIWTKVNVLLYPGETEATLNETRIWLNTHAKYIKGVSVGPLILYRYGSSTVNFLEQIKSKGANEVFTGNLDLLGYSDLNLSKNFSNERAISTALEISRELMSERDYYDLKSFNYFNRNLNFSKFHQVTTTAPKESLPFSIVDESNHQPFELEVTQI